MGGPKYSREFCCQRDVGKTKEIRQEGRQGRVWVRKQQPCVSVRARKIRTQIFFLDLPERSRLNTLA